MNLSSDQKKTNKTMKQIYLKRGKEESLQRFHPWVFSGAIAQMDEGIEEGEVVNVLTGNGDFIAVGHFQNGSIAIRVLSFNHVSIDDAFWHSRLSSALKMRQSIGIADNPTNNTYRLVHGEGDLLPGLVIDVYGKTAVMQAHSIGMHMSRKAIAAQLMDVMEGRQYRCGKWSEILCGLVAWPKDGILRGSA